MPNAVEMCHIGLRCLFRYPALEKEGENSTLKNENLRRTNMLSTPHVNVKKYTLKSHRKAIVEKINIMGLRVG